MLINNYLRLESLDLNFGKTKSIAMKLPQRNYFWIHAIEAWHTCCLETAANTLDIVSSWDCHSSLNSESGSLVRSLHIVAIIL